MNRAFAAVHRRRLRGLDPGRWWSNGAVSICDTHVLRVAARLHHESRFRFVHRVDVLRRPPAL